MIAVRRFLQQFSAFFVGGFFFLGIARKTKVVESFFLVKTHVAEKGELRVHAVAEQHVAEFVSKNRCQAGFVR